LRILGQFSSNEEKELLQLLSAHGGKEEDSCSLKFILPLKTSHSGLVQALSNELRTRNKANARRTPLESVFATKL